MRRLIQNSKDAGLRILSVKGDCCYNENEGTATLSSLSKALHGTLIQWTITLPENRGWGEEA